MGKLLVALLCALFFVGGFGSGLAVEEMLEIPYEKGELSGMSFVRDNRAYVKLFHGLSISDVTNLWNDLIIFESMEIKDIELYINSPGGDAFSGLALADHIMRAQKRGFNITAHASGIIASAAVPVLAVCGKRQATPGTIFMVHEASLWKWPGRETASDIRAQNELMKLLKYRYIKMLTEHSDVTSGEWELMERETTWFSAEQALEWGLLDKIE